MKKTGAKLIWASTTPIPDDPARKQTAASIVERNRAAAELMARHGIAIDDLFTAITPHLAEMQNPGDVHFNAPGLRFPRPDRGDVHRAGHEVNACRLRLNEKDADDDPKRPNLRESTSCGTARDRRCTGSGGNGKGGGGKRPGQESGRLGRLPRAARPGVGSAGQELLRGAVRGQRSGRSHDLAGLGQHAATERGPHRCDRSPHRFGTGSHRPERPAADRPLPADHGRKDPRRHHATGAARRRSPRYRRNRAGADFLAAADACGTARQYRGTGHGRGRGRLLLVVPTGGIGGAAQEEPRAGQPASDPGDARRGRSMCTVPACRRRLRHGLAGGPRRQSPPIVHQHRRSLSVHRCGGRRGGRRPQGGGHAVRRTAGLAPSLVARLLPGQFHFDPARPDGELLLDSDLQARVVHPQRRAACAI